MRKKLAVLGIHGFSGHPAELRFLGERVAHNLGATLFIPTLPGHATTPEDLAKITYHDWCQFVEKEFDRLHKTYDEVVVIGNSFGANLALKLAERRPVDAIVAVAIPRLTFWQDALLRFLIVVNKPFGQFWQKPKIGRLATEKIPGYRQRAYEKIPFTGIEKLIEFGDQETSPQQLASVSAPTLFVVPTGDPFVPHSAARYYCQHIGSAEKEILAWEDHYHLVVQGERKAALAQAVSKWLKKAL